MDTVRLTRDWDDGRPEPSAPVIAEHPDTALVEAATAADLDEHGLPKRDLLDDLITVPYGIPDVVSPPPQLPAEASRKLTNPAWDGPARQHRAWSTLVHAMEITRRTTFSRRSERAPRPP